ncbi:hypothetical protein [Zavarzinia compransoris]|uniref:DUF4190 domain-containing protein n=1 Tax=Zavarzinia compransoris TaxID=1264899 RepID=A0A317DWC2_9PROT|nr:hypothetical protein [Zavarzinia compransoris]PWR19008.1 hypothetical protein DKG75_18750 [Zavarzinia compransoris]TDP49010.1 hypothetical protein DES42_101371 [Zavarzinia compransoris]
MSDTDLGKTQPGLVTGIISCVCALFGFMIPVLGIVLAVVGLVLGIVAWRGGQAGNYQLGLILGVIGTILNGLALLIVIFAMGALATIFTAVSAGRGGF